MSSVGKLVRYVGDVQGVGFRYTAMRLAQSYDLDGYVTNLPDGDVEVYAEGPQEQVQAYLQALKDRMGAYIRDVKQQDRPPDGKLNGFDIRF